MLKNYTPEELSKVKLLRSRGLDMISMIRELRSEFSLNVAEAKELILLASTGNDIATYQGELLPDLVKVLDGVFVDLSVAKSSKDIHMIFSDSLPFPDYYGHNWDAFWDVLSDGDFFPQKLTIKGVEHLQNNLVSDYDILVKMFAEYNAGNPVEQIDFVWI